MTGRVSQIIELIAFFSQCKMQVERGTANKGDEVEVVGLGNGLKTTLIGIGKYTVN